MTLGEYYRIVVMAYGRDSAPAKYFARLIMESPRGQAEPVLADESQMIALIASLAERDKQD